VDFNRKEVIARITFLIRSTAEGSTVAADKHTVPDDPQSVIYSGTSPAMKHVDPYELLSEDIDIIYREAHEDAMDDGKIDPDEHRHLKLILRCRTRITDLGARRKLMRHIEQGGPITDYTRRLAVAAGMGITDLEAERVRRSGKIVNIHDRQSAG